MFLWKFLIFFHQWTGILSFELSLPPRKGDGNIKMISYIWLGKNRVYPPPLLIFTSRYFVRGFTVHVIEIKKRIRNPFHVDTVDFFYSFFYSVFLLMMVNRILNLIISNSSFKYKFLLKCAVFAPENLFNSLNEWLEKAQSGFGAKKWKFRIL